MSRPPADPAARTADPPLLEREAELVAVDAALAQASSGSGSLLVVEGPAGVGKSRLVAAAVHRAHDRDMLTVSARGHPAGREVAFGVAGQLFDFVLRRSSEQQRRRLLSDQAALAVPLFVPTAEQAGTSGPALVQGLFWLVVNLLAVQEPPTAGGLLLVVDDAQWSDRSSLAFLAHLGARLEDMEVAVVVTARRDEPEAPQPELGWLLDSPRAVRLAPAALSDQAVDHLVAERFGNPPAAEFTAACARASGGNPFLLQALLDALATDRVAPSAESAGRIAGLVPDEVLRMVAVRLGRLPAPAGALASAVAVLGADVPLRRATRLAGLPAEEAESAADTLAAAHLFAPGDPLSFAHPLIGSAVAAEQSAFARSRAHRRAAELLHAEGVAPDLVATQLLDTRPDADPWAVRTLRAGAVRAVARGEPAGAVHFLRRALDEPPGSEDRNGVLVELARAEAAAGRTDSVVHFRAALVEAEESSATSDLRAELARMLFLQGDAEGGEQLVEEGLAEVAPDSPEGEALLSAYLTGAAYSAALRPRVTARLAPVMSAASAGRMPADPALCAHLAVHLAVTGGPRSLIAAVAAAAQRADPLVDGAADGMAVGLLGASLFEVGELDACCRAMDAAAEAARRRGAVIALGTATYFRGEVYYQRGKLDDAGADASLAITVSPAGWAATLGWPTSLLAHIEIERGDLDAARAALALLPASAATGYERCGLLQARARLALVDGDPDTALTDYESAGSHLATFPSIRSCMFPWRHGAALAAYRLGRGERARAYAQAAVTEARELGPPRILAAALRTAGEVADAKTALPLLTESVAVASSSASPLEHARSLVALGARLRHARPTDKAREPLYAGLELADRFGAVALAERARAGLRATGARPRRAARTGADALTPTERAIADLAARGLSNLAIAQERYVTVKTVEFHLGQAYRKLGVAQRGELAEALHS